MGSEKSCLEKNQDVDVVVESGTKFLVVFSQEKSLKPPCLKYLNFCQNLFIWDLI